jgi:hypothetical protein
MTREEIRHMQRRIRQSYPPQHRANCDDGFWGPLSIAACQKHLRDMMPKPNPWPRTDQASLAAFYGRAGDVSQLVFIDVTGLGVRFAGQLVTRVRVHRKCADSLLRIIRKLTTSPQGRHFLATYAGVFYDRAMRQGTNPSLHARGAAIDGDAARNGLWTQWPARAKMPLEVMEVFAGEGWLPAGAFWHRDAMHFQATR